MWVEEWFLPTVRMLEASWFEEERSAYRFIVDGIDIALPDSSLVTQSEPTADQLIVINCRPASRTKLMRATHPGHSFRKGQNEPTIKSPVRQLGGLL